MIKLKRPPNDNFFRYFGMNLLFWGVPLLVLQLIGAPAHSLGMVIVFELTLTVLGVFLISMIEYVVLRSMWKRQARLERDGPSASKGDTQ
jgi:hypothetical protein